MNLRVIKKDVDYMIDEVVSDAIMSLNFTEDQKKQEEFVRIANDAVILRDQTYGLLNHPDKSKIKAYYREKVENFIKSVDELFDRISKNVK